MNRRELLHGLGSVAFSAAGYLDTLLPRSTPIRQTRSQITSTAESLPSSIAGVKMVDSKVARAATQLSRSVSPTYLFNHTIRTFLFGSLIGRAQGKSFDEEVFYLACILHDLGLTERFEGDLPFEIQGAEAAKQFLKEQAYATNSSEIIWDGIAMHASAIGQFKRPEIALVGEGAGADVLGDLTQINKVDANAILKAFPRMRFKEAFVKTCSDIVQRHPKGATRSFMRDIGERYVPAFHPRNFCDLVRQAPFEE